MRVLGIETSCDECAAAVVENGKDILSNVIATQIPFHEKYQGVVPEIASRMHVEWIRDVVDDSLTKAGLRPRDLDGVAVTSCPGLGGSLLVGLSFAKSFAWALGIPFIGVNHILAHLYAPMLERPLEYPFLGLLVSGGHTIICRVDGFDDIAVLGTTIDDAVGEAFDKVAKYYGLGYPGGVVMDALAEKGNPLAYRFPKPNLSKGDHAYDVSYSGLKTAAINQLDQFAAPGTVYSPGNLAASFRRTAVEILLARVFKAAEDTGLKTIVAGGGVAANSLLRKMASEKHGLDFRFPPLGLCSDNGAMVAGLGYQYLSRSVTSPWSITASARVPRFKHAAGTR